MTPEERIAAASKFLLQSPPGEINDVLNDIRAIISDDASLESGILPALREYNLAQFITVDVPGQSHQVIISRASQVADAEDRYVDPKAGITFSLDHLTLETSDPQPLSQESAPLRKSLETAASKYVSDHFPDGIACVFGSDASASQYTIQIVANKYNPTNFWSGRWRSEYVVDVAKGEITGKIWINAHYYEQGNVQLASEHNPVFEFPPNSSAADKIVALIAKEEGEYQASLSEVYFEMGDKTFKGLRRMLPMTRQKIDWDRVMGYKLGAELATGKSPFSGS
ncbi:hypothetical protein BOTBODRAFT_26823 [Botryobasidium botryosum FD-172 SS1]|uniref:F-actin-capping protein subunit alpha n=1 Tax=Botryobasidium botryosum (strain FD-172 SS1) TaxID=930990 RepID=A0A067MZ01_BOTB1|nr:hypothetical protein BOTBODRAFT_26823 [Botryobasidium botryosum FD-172 SS1]